MSSNNIYLIQFMCKREIIEVPIYFQGLRLADPHRQTDQHKHKVGRIYKFDFKKPNQKPMPLEIKGKLDLQDFNPHGLSAWEDKTTGKRERERERERE